MNNLITQELKEMAKKARDAFAYLSIIGSEEKNIALKNIVDSLKQNREAILQANHLDVTKMKECGEKEALIERLALDSNKFESICIGILDIIKLNDPVYEVFDVIKRPNGLQIAKMYVPFGVIAMIYESRPNVTVDAAVMALKTSNVVILKGGKEAINTNLELVRAMREGLKKSGFPEDCILFVNRIEREYATQLMKLKGDIDLLIPRGGAGLIRSVVENATVPVIETGTGNCHLYVDARAKIENALDIAYNAKVQRPGACNAIETILVHRDIAKEFLSKLKDRFYNRVHIKGDNGVKQILPSVEIATEEDFQKEFLDFIVAVKIVDSIDEAITHINLYGTKHSEIIVTEDYSNIIKFQKQVDAAVVYVNASSRFSDGGEFGFGAEIGISTQKFHARGPMGLKEIMTYKYVVIGEGQIR
mgnify:FL=1